LDESFAMALDGSPPPVGRAPVDLAPPVNRAPPVDMPLEPLPVGPLRVDPMDVVDTPTTMAVDGGK
jgi:hypothetical protein